MAGGAGSSSSAKRAKVDKAKEEEDPLVRRREELVLMDANMRANAIAKGKELEEGLVREAKEIAERLFREADEVAKRLKSPCEKSKRYGLRRKAKKEGERLVREAKEKGAIFESNRILRKMRQSFGQELRSVCAALEAKNEKLLRRLPSDLWKIINENLHKNLHQNDLLALAMTCRFFRDTTKGLSRKLETNLNPNRLLELQKSGKMASHSLSWFRWVCDTLEILPGRRPPKYRRVEGAVYEGNLVNYAAFQGSVEILRWLIKEKGWKLNRDTGWWAATGGSVKVLEYLRKKGYKFITTLHGERSCLHINCAARGGHLEAVEYFRRQDPDSPADECICDWAAREGRLEVLKCARAQDPPCPWTESICSWAASRGHLEILKFARGQDPPCPWDVRTCIYAAREGHLEVLKWARGQDPPCPWEDDICTSAAERGRLDVLMWLRDQDPPCPWDTDTTLGAAAGGHLEVLQWLLEQDPPCPWDRDRCSYAAEDFYAGDLFYWARFELHDCFCGYDVAKWIDWITEKIDLPNQRRFDGLTCREMYEYESDVSDSDFYSSHDSDSYISHDSDSYSDS
ncbi:putative ankyrin repeat protein [Chloropicon roscoffensis]|uniref:Ankyrin repeat protein n=1 Tax=Chloropicon roscoffensis TaxID=1461544 RepID=A0AAX4NYF9_9CHLO